MCNIGGRGLQGPLNTINDMGICLHEARGLWCLPVVRLGVRFKAAQVLKAMKEASPKFEAS